MEKANESVGRVAAREAKIIRTSAIGILGNLVLVAFKAAVGFISGSIAVILDAVNNLSDALSSVITIIGIRLSNRRPDKKHPYGHGRIEYLTGVLISVIVLLAGVTSIRESVTKIFSPEKATYGTVSIIIIVAAILAKLLMGKYVKSVGQKVNSGALIASGSDALFDALLSSGTLLAVIANLVWGWSLEGVIGTLISIFIIKAGVEMLMDTLHSIIGTRFDRELTDPLKEKIASFPGVQGVYDLTLHNYGPSRIMGSAHIEVPDQMTAREIHRLTRSISMEIYTTFGIVLTIGVYAANKNNPEIAAIKSDVERVTGSYPEILQMHGFYVENTIVSFDLIVDFKAEAEEIREKVVKELSGLYPQFTFQVILDSDFSD